MARSSALEPLEKFRFSISWTTGAATSSAQGTLVRAGFHDVQMPKRSTNKGTYREGTDRDINQLFAGLSSMEDVVLSKGLLPNGSGTAENEFYKWMSAVHTPSAGNSLPQARPAGSASYVYRKDVTISQLDRQGVVVRQWILHNAWPINFVPGSDLNAGEDGEKSLQQLTLAYEDFEEQIGTTADAIILPTPEAAPTTA